MKHTKHTKWLAKFLAIGCMLTATSAIASLCVNETGKTITIASASTHYAQPTAGSSAKLTGMQMYHPDLDTGFTLTNPVSKTVYGSSAYTSMKVVCDGSVRETTYGGTKAYAVKGSKLSVSLSLNYNAGVGSPITANNEWMVCDDSWGLTEGQLVNGVKTGEIDSGCLIVQTSTDNKSWSTRGYTTDYYNNFGANERTVYEFNGGEVNSGLYVRMLYCYEVYDYRACTHSYKEWVNPFKKVTKYSHTDDNQYQNYVEAYNLFVCSDNVEAVTFHNLSVSGSDELKDETGATLEYLAKAETLTNNSLTHKGFEIDTDLLPTATLSVKRNGVAYTLPNDKKITQDGCYDITVTTRFGTAKTTRIYVDTRTIAKAKQAYFGEGILAGSKRIYGEGNLPVYEGGLTKYTLQAVENSYLPLYGTITNKITGKVIAISRTRERKIGVLTDAGEYEILLYTNPTYATNAKSGDNTTFRFRFRLISEGTAPGPVVNQRNLKKYMQSNVSDLNPFYYGSTYRSSGRGDITVVFSTYERAYEYAYQQNVGSVEESGDGTYRYYGPFLAKSKQKYEDSWTLTNAIHYFTEQSVEEKFFDLSDAFTYTTLSDELLQNKNLRTLELPCSVVVFASEEDREALLQNADVPVFGLKKTSVVLKKATDTPTQGVSDFVFIKDSMGFDSYTVSLMDASTSRTYKIEYGKGVAEQLKSYNLPSGQYVIIESTVYGDVTSYPVRYINDNTATVTVEYVLDGTTKKTEITQANAEDLTINTESFSLSVFDKMDEYTFVKVTKIGEFERAYAGDDLQKILFEEEGEYRIVCVNTLGYTFTFHAVVEKAEKVELLLPETPSEPPVETQPPVKNEQKQPTTTTPSEPPQNKTNQVDATQVSSKKTYTKSTVKAQSTAQEATVEWYVYLIGGAVVLGIILLTIGIVDSVKNKED